MPQKGDFLNVSFQNDVNLPDVLLIGFAGFHCGPRPGVTKLNSKALCVEIKVKTMLVKT